MVFLVFNPIIFKNTPQNYNNIFNYTNFYTQKIKIFSNIHNKCHLKAKQHTQNMKN